MASSSVASIQAAQSLHLSNGSSPLSKSVPTSAFLGAGLKKLNVTTAPPNSSKPLVVRAREDETKQTKKDRWGGLAYDTSDDQQDITRGKGMVDSLFQGAVGVGTQHAVMSSYDYISTAQRNLQMDNMKDGLYIAPAFMDKLVVHIAKNFMNLPNIKVPLILGVWGGKGQGKSFQCELVFSKLGINPIMMSAGELESGNAGEPAKLIRQRYREAADIIQKKGKMCVLFINDLDAGAGRMGGTTQYTVNNQMVNATLMNIADNPTNVQLPGIYIKEELPRVPIIVTGNDFSTLYAPLIRDGRMEKFYWAPTRDDRVGVCKGIFRTDNVPDKDVEQLVDTFPGQSIDFFGALRARVYDDEVRNWVGGIGVENMGKNLVNTRQGPPKFNKPAMTLAKLLEYGQMLVREQDNVKRVQLADKYLRESALGDANEDDFKKENILGSTAGVPVKTPPTAKVPEAAKLQEEKPEIKVEEKLNSVENVAAEELKKPTVVEEESKPVIPAAEQATSLQEEKEAKLNTAPAEKEKGEVSVLQEDKSTIAAAAEQVAQPVEKKVGVGKKEREEERVVTREVVSDALRSLASSILSIFKA